MLPTVMLLEGKINNALWNALIVREWINPWQIGTTVARYKSQYRTAIRVFIPWSLGLHDSSAMCSHVVYFKAMCHTDVEAPIVTNWFPYFLTTSLFFGLKRSKLLFSYLLPTITCFALSRKTYWFGEIRETDSLAWELQHRYATLP